MLGEELYARLYWAFDWYYNGQEPSLFKESGMDWRRMRTGFEQMMEKYPESHWNRATFASFACRAGDSTTYGLLRPKLQDTQFWNAAPEGMSVEVCDARFMKKT